MSRLFRAALTAAAAALVATPTASAESVEVAPGHLVDASADGHYLLIERPGNAVVIVDRTTGQERVVPGGGKALDLASHSPRALISRDDDLVVYDADAGTSTVANYDEAGDWTFTKPGARLVQDGRLVAFSTDTPTRILTRDVVTDRTTLRVNNGGVFSDASEDGRLVTYARPLPTEFRPAALTPHPDDPKNGVRGSAIGFQISGDVPRLFAGTTFYQSQPHTDDPATCLATPVTAVYELPVGLRLQQDGDAPRYLFTVGTLNPLAPAGQPTMYWFQHDSPGALGGGENLTNSSTLRTDPSSSAATLVTGPAPGPAMGTDVTVLDDRDRQTRLLGFDPNLTALDPVIPVQRGAGVVYGGRGPDGTWTTYADMEVRTTPLAPGTTSTGFSALAGTHFPDSPLLRTKPSWAYCGTRLVKGAASEYASVTTRSTGASAGSVVVNLTPSGKSPARYVDFVVRLAGIPVWSRHQNASGTVTLPQILPFTKGYNLYTQIATEVGAQASITPLYRKYL